ncbi:MAG: TolC family protein [Bryobacterales bacterium]|nr:TolC family protein [Bryobacteraceae bacterium]MDW8129414.1 TolC family protein [Bryobacterales bacterium]
MFRRILAIAWACQLAVPALAENPARRNSGGFFSGLTRPYRAREIPPVDLANSSRLESLLRAGRIYLSLQDAVALALENNLDIAVQRYGPMIADAALLRAEAGGLLRGVPTAVQRATTSALAQVTGGATGAAGGVGGGTAAQAGAGEAGGAIIVQTGTAVPSLDPVIFTQANFSHRTNPQTNSFITGTNSLIIRNDVANFGIQKGFLTGATVSFGWNNSRVETNAGRTDFNPSTTASFSLTIQQPLLRGFGLAVNNRNIRIARNNRKVSDLAFRQQVMTTVAAIVSAYWDLVSFNENVRVRQQTLALAEKLYEDNKKQVEIGTLAPIEIVRAEAEVASSRQALVQAEAQLLQQETLLKNALSRTGVASPLIADARIVPTDRIYVPPSDPVSPVQDLVELALKNRPDVAQVELQIENTKIGLKGSRNNLLPQLDVVADFRNNALVGQINKLPIPGIPGTGIGPQTRNPAAVDPFFIGGYGKALAQLFARNFPDYGIGFQLTVPLRNRSAQADLILDQLSLRQQELRRQALLNQVRVDVRNALTALQQARAAYEAAVKARELQEQTLEAEQKKYALGASTIFFVIQAQRDLAQARSAEVAAASQYAKAKVQLEAATGQILEAYNISIEEALEGRVSRPPSPLPPGAQSE